jgi:DNA mismatch repair protein MutS
MSTQDPPSFRHSLFDDDLPESSTLAAHAPMSAPPARVEGASSPAKTTRARRPKAAAAGVAADEARPTPMMAQYIEIKAANPDCLLFYRMGDFYEMFFEDAEIASRALGIVLTKRGKHNGADIAMCGVPIDRADDYLHRLIGLGHRVAVCEQMEDPAEARKRGAKSVVRRDVVRLITPGTLTEDRLLAPAQANYLMALARVRASDESWIYGLASADISTGVFHICETDHAGIATEIARFEPSEIIAPDHLCEEPDMIALFADQSIKLTPFAPRAEGMSAHKKLCDYFGLATLDGLGMQGRAEIAAASLLILYIERTQLGARPSLSLPQRLTRAHVLEIDAATRANLELTRTLSGEKTGSLLHTIDMTLTASGGRLLAERIASPLTDPIAIAQRHDSIAYLAHQNYMREDIRAHLRAVPDIARVMSRLALDRAGPRDLAALRDGLAACHELAAGMKDAQDLPDELRACLAHMAAVPRDLHRHLMTALSDNVPLNKRDGHFIRSSYQPALDDMRILRDESRRVIATLQARYSDLIQSKQVRVKHNHFLGYYVEVPQSMGETMLRPPLNEHFIHRQTMADAMRFSTTELSELEAKIASAADRALAMELAIFDDLVRMITAHEQAIKHAVSALAVFDVSTALAEVAVRREWVRPIIDHSLTFDIEAGRHPVVEAALAHRGAAFVANGTDLSGQLGVGGMIALVTGPNMAGKSTYLRQNALMVVLAQMGSFVPAARAHIGVVDRLFSRVGAADDLARGRSTFMVEMVETAAILNQATERSLVILDEIGRGTATFDGLAIAWACVEYLHNHNRPRALFATHFHELTHLAGQMERLINVTVRVSEWKGDVVFLHEVIRGAADRSYGIHVAQLAGLPAHVVARAHDVLAQLEAHDRTTLMRDIADDIMRTPPSQPQQIDPLYEQINALDLDNISPREALAVLYQLKAGLR